jgi:exopolysaccharide biosynthesis polyprenyl glycosylphosphotransferase
MLLHRIRGLWNTYHGILAVVLTLVFWSYLLIVAGVFKNFTAPNPERFMLYNLAGVFGLVIAAIRGRSAAARLLAGGFVECHTLALKQAVYVGVTMLVVLVAGMDPTGVSPLRHDDARINPEYLRLSLVFAFLLVLYFVLLICHLVVPKRLADILFSAEGYEQRTLLVGPVEKARKIAKWIEETAASGFGMRGSVPDDDGEESRILHVTRVTDVAMLERIIKNEGIKQMLLLEIPLDPEALGLVVNLANRTGVRLLVVNNLKEIFNHDITLFNLHNQGFISLRDEPLEDPVSRIVKSVMDKLICLPIVVFVLPPLCLVVMIFQAIQAPGPVFYRQTRAGLANRPFRIFKFRTMRIEREDAPGSKESKKQATAGDPRIYPMGRILRKTSLDEIPQFLNVLFGHMSVVGPRPHMIIHNRRFNKILDKYHVRTFAKPGITGLAQISGYRGEAKDDEDVVERARLDIEYIENWSLPLDFWIILKTFVQVVKPPKTAY